MRVDKTTLLGRLASITGDLRLAQGTPSDHLEQARIKVAQAIAAGQRESPTVLSETRSAGQPRISTSIPQTGIEQAADSALSQPEQVSRILVSRREVPIAHTGLTTDLMPDWAAGRAIDTTLGPFHDDLGRPVWIDVFRIVRQLRLVRSPGAAPFLTLPLEGIIAKGDHFILPAGTVWIASRQLASNAPAGGYTGLLIRGGKLSFSSPVAATGDEIVVAPAITCTLSLNLDPGSAPSGSGFGEDARLAISRPPSTVTIVFTSTGAKIQSASNGHVEVYGSSADVNPTNGMCNYVAELGRILVPANTNVGSFAIADVRSDQFRLAGNAVISSAAWALPVAVISPDSLGRAAGAGSLALILKDGLTASWRGQTTDVPAGPLALIVEPGLITVVASTVRSLGARKTIPLWSKQPGDLPSSQVELSWSAQFPLRYFSSSSGAELLLLVGMVRANFDRPVTVAGNRVFIQSKVALIIFIESAVFNGIILESNLDPPPSSSPLPTNGLAFALANAILRCTPAKTLLLVATYDGTRSVQGGVSIGFGLQYLLPILPDPYASNVDVPYLKLRDIGVLGPIHAVVTWTDANSPILTYSLPPEAANLTKALAASNSSEANPTLTRAETLSSVAAVATGPGALILLDLSTNVDQFGVAWTSHGRNDRAIAATTAGSGSMPLTVNSMFIEGQSSSVYVLTVPAVQWEPVFTESPPAFPSPLTFADSGGPTAITVQSVQLVRIAPAPALDNLVENFSTASAPSPALARLTLPFGIEAFSIWNKPRKSSPRGATVAYNRPKFSSESVKGGYQISVRAVDPAAPDSPSLQGYAIQRRNGLFAGVPVNKSILDDQVDTIFNGYVGPSGLRPQVPVTRIDLSGYGESLFSDWLNNTDDPVAVSQARFDVLIGRTAYEVIQVRSILYPYGVRVVRTITIDRKNSGSIVRKDSGWQAVSDGEYNYPGVGLTTHPGVVQQITNVTNIRDTGQLIDVGGGAQVAGVLFDGDLAIEGAIKGISPSGSVPARDQIGYVQLTPASSGCLLPAQYQQLIATAGPLGGNIDCVLNIGGSGQLMKVGRVGVGVTQGLGGPEFVMTAWGSPQFPQGGQWSFLRQTGAGAAPEVVDQELGIPLIRAGAAPAPPSLSSPYRFADPIDLSSPATPASDYGIVHATGTQRIFFPRPKIEASAPDRITSTVPPILADPYSLANSVGYFPRTDSAIPFPSANYALIISSGGNYRLQLPTPSFPVTIGQRTLSEASGVRSYADYAGSVAKVQIDTSAPVPWSFRLEGVNIGMSSGLLGEVMRVTSTVDAAANIITTLKDSRITFGGALGVVQDVLEILQTIGFPSPLNVAMTNKIQFKAGLKIPMDEELNKLMPPGGPEFDDTDVVVSLGIDSPISEASFELGATLLIPTPFDPLKAAGMIKIEIKMSTDSGNTFTLTVGAGVGVSFNVGGFGCKAYFMETMFLIAGDSVLGFGVGLLIKGSIDLGIVSVDVSVEAKMAILKVTCPDTTIYGAAQVTFAVEVTIAFVIDIDFEVQAEEDQNLNGGPCPLPDVL
jgi:hypothetical protein